MPAISIRRLESQGGNLVVSLSRDGLHLVTLPAEGLLEKLSATRARWDLGRLPPGRRARLLAEVVQVLVARRDDAADYAYLALAIAFNEPRHADRLRAQVLEALKARSLAMLWIAGDDPAFEFVVGEPQPVPDDGTGGDTVREASPAVPSFPKGAGYLIDCHLRREAYLVLPDDGANRLAGHRQSAPVYADFFRLGGQALELLPERDHAFDMTDLMDAVTSDEYAVGDREVAALPDGVIHSYTPISPLSFTFESGDASTSALIGVSMVRRGGTVSWIALFGVAGGFDEEDLPAGLGARVLELSRGRPIEFPGRVEGMTAHAQVVLWGSLDIEGEEMVRFGRSFWFGPLRMDVPSTGEVADELKADGERVLAGVAGRQEEDPLVAATTAIGKVVLNGATMEVFLECLKLPAYFKTFVEQVVEEKADVGPREGTRVIPLAGAGADSRYRVVRTLRRVAMSAGRAGGGADGKRHYSPPSHRVEVDGFWRPLRANGIGRGPDGRPEIGRTWVTGHQRWKGLPPRVGVVRVKQPVSATLRAVMEDADTLDVSVVTKR